MISISLFLKKLYNTKRFLLHLTYLTYITVIKFNDSEIAIRKRIESEYRTVRHCKTSIQALSFTEINDA